MLSRILTVSLIGVTVLCTSCGKPDTADSLSAELAAKIDEVSTEIGTVKDKESAELAAKRIGEIGDEFTSIAKRFDALGEPSEADRELVKGRLVKAMQAMQDKRMDSMESGVSVESMLILGKSIEEFGNKTDGVNESLKRFVES